MRKSIFNKRNTTFVVSLIISFIFIGLIVGCFISNKNKTIKTLEKVSVENSLLRAANIMFKCKEAGGTVIQPADKFKGGGPVCNLSFDDDKKNEWPSMPKKGDYQYQYRQIRNDFVSAGTEDKLLASCKLGLSINCTLEN